jgi:hypothetical protein
VRNALGAPLRSLVTNIYNDPVLSLLLPRNRIREPIFYDFGHIKNSTYHSSMFTSISVALDVDGRGSLVSLHLTFLALMHFLLLCFFS